MLWLTKIECNRWKKSEKRCADISNNTVDILNTKNADDLNIGQNVVFLLSDLDKNRSILQLYIDAIAFTCHLGQPKLLLRFKANCHLCKIAQKHLEGQNATYPPYFVAGVFYIKQKTILANFKVCFNSEQSHVFTIGYQRCVNPYILCFWFPNK